jgi:hypothetical protein
LIAKQKKTTNKHKPNATRFVGTNTVAPKKLPMTPYYTKEETMGHTNTPQATTPPPTTTTNLAFVRGGSFSHRYSMVVSDCWYKTVSVWQQAYLESELAILRALMMLHCCLT